MFGRNKKDPEPVIEAVGIVTQVQDTGATVNDNPRVKLSLNVRPEGAAAFDVTKKVTISRVNLPRIGDPIRVKYFASDPEASLKVQRRTPEDLAAAAAPAPAPAPAVTATDPLDQISKLNELRQAGALSDAEFETEKAKILART
jgi:hypothetical protein